MTQPWPPQQQQPTWAQPQYSWQALPNGEYGWVPFYDGPLGQVRSTASVIGLSIITFGIYIFVYNYKVHDEMKRHSDRGLGGGIALLLTFVANIAMPFLTPNEVGNLYTRKGQRPPVRGWTGLWVLLTVYGGQVLLFLILIGSTVSTADDQGYVDGSTDDSLPTGFFLGLVVYGLAVIAGGVVWAVKTNGALNRYWQTMALGGFNAHRQPQTPAPPLPS